MWNFVGKQPNFSNRSNTTVRLGTYRILHFNTVVIIIRVQCSNYTFVTTTVLYECTVMFVAFRLIYCVQ